MNRPSSRALAAAMPALILSLSSLAQAGEGWITSFESAKTTAAKENKDIMMDFTGSDWCGWCIKLQKEVFTTDTFKQEAPQHFVLLELDYPQKKELPKEEKEQNDAMQKTYSVEGFPTILLTDAKGRPYAKTGYQAGGPEAYNKHLNELRQVREKRDAAFKRAEAAGGLEKANAINEGLKALEPELVMAYYSAEVDQIIGLDAEDKIGFKAKKEYSTKRAGLDKELKELAQAQKPKDFEEAIDAFIAKEKIAPADLQDLMLTKLQVLGPADLDKADALMDAVIKVDEKSELAGRAKEIKTRIVAMREQVEKSKKDPAAKEEKDEPEKK